MSHSLKAGEAGFFALNADWQYAIRHANQTDLIRFDGQKDGKWLAHKAGADAFRILSESVVLKMLNQALAGPHIVAALHLQTEEVMLFESKALKQYLTQKAQTL